MGLEPGHRLDSVIKEMLKLDRSLGGKWGMLEGVMEIVLSLDEEDIVYLRHREAQEYPLSLPIAFRNGEQFYPSRGWRDFGVVILGWWTWHFLELVGTARVHRFMFMNGPYGIQVRHRRSTGMMELRPYESYSSIRASGRPGTRLVFDADLVWECTPYELGTALREAGSKLLGALQRLDLGDRDQAALAERLYALEEAIRRLRSGY